MPIDPEPYFFRWDSVVALASKDQQDKVGIASYQHKTCKHLVNVDETRIPPKICPWCGADTVQEAKLEENMKRSGAVLLEAPSKPVVPKIN